MLSRIKLLLFIHSIPVLLCAQNSPEEAALERMENASAGSDTELSETSATGQMTQTEGSFRINLNTDEPELLDLLPGIGNWHILAIKSHLRRYGPFRSVYELQAVEGFDSVLIRQLLPFVETEPGQLKTGGKPNHLRLGLYRKSKRSAGYKRTDSLAFLGSPYRLDFRLNLQFNKLHIGIQVEKDPGEKAENGFLSGFVNYAAHRHFHITVGDMRFGSGQGLVMGLGGFSAGKSVHSGRIIRTPAALKPNTSNNENGFIRGAGFQFQAAPGIKLILLCGLSQSDASAEMNGVLALDGSGLYRNVSEIQKRGRFKILSNNLYIGLQNRFGVFGISSSLKFQGILPAVALMQTGTKTIHSGLNWQKTFGSALLFGEIAKGKRNEHALLAGCLWAAGKKTDVSLLYRNYSPSYTNVFASGFGEFGNTGNENGMYTSVSLRLTNRWKLGFFHDAGKHSAPRYKASGIGHFSSGMAELRFEQRKAMTLIFSCRRELQTENAETEIGMRPMLQTGKTRLRLQLQQNSGKLRFSGRIEQTSGRGLDGKREKGYLFYQDIRAELTKNSSLQLRLCAFNAANHAYRGFVMEADVQGRQYISGFGGKGIRFYALLSCKQGKDLRIWFKFASVGYADRTETGSGNDTIDAPGFSEFSIQIQWKLPSTPN